ncbi:MAG: hypothetical protein SO122_06740 [Eubacteriales bacterium]|nr:hypothetical protein [Eubacteriales bacterium]
MTTCGHQKRIALCEAACGICGYRLCLRRICHALPVGAAYFLRWGTLCGAYPRDK